MVWGCRYAPDGRVVRTGADMGIKQQKIDDGLNASLDTLRTLRRMRRDIVEN
jgi:hypothetical protein